MTGPLFLSAWLAAGAAVTPAPPVAAGVDAAVRAIVAAVQARMGAHADVAVDSVIALRAPAGTVVDAVPMPGAKLGGALRFVFRAASPGDESRLTPAGHADVTLRVVVEHAHAAKPLKRGDRLERADVVAVTHAVTTGALKPLPTTDDALHARALRDLPADACLARQALALMPAVVAGDDVVAVMRAGGVEVRADLVAVDSGQRGATVRVSNPQSRRTFRARVVARGLVEISHE